MNIASKLLKQIGIASDTWMSQTSLIKVLKIILLHLPHAMLHNLWTLNVKKEKGISCLVQRINLASVATKMMLYTIVNQAMVSTICTLKLAKMNQLLKIIQYPYNE